MVVFVFFWFKKDNMEIIKICYSEHCFTVEVAKTQAQREMGLMFRESLDQDKAMLFVFDQPGIYSFWMKNCLIPLDIIWLDENYKIVVISPNNPPCSKTGNCSSINPNVSAKYVLEINAGLSNKINLKPGDHLSISPTLDK